ncbi:MAG TPA: hypothetical protein VK611_17825 [Acidimicrobiales bacterium]|nr:hypothetical protein [Acidimicrobiales bacterium]
MANHIHASIDLDDAVTVSPYWDDEDEHDLEDDDNDGWSVELNERPLPRGGVVGLIVGVFENRAEAEQQAADVRELLSSWAARDRDRKPHVEPAERWAAYSAEGEGTPWGLTPRMACQLHMAADVEADMLRDNGLDDAGYVLPRAARRVVTPEFWGRFVQCFEDLAARLAEPDDDLLPRCVGEEVALAHVIEQAKSRYLDMSEGWVVAGLDLSELPSNQELDTDFEHYADVLFEDRDFELLWMPRFDGIEDDEELQQELRIANLHPSRWFLPFRPDEGNDS